MDAEAVAGVESGSATGVSASVLPRQDFAALRDEVRTFLRDERARGGFTPRVNCWVRYDAAFTRRCGERGFIGVAFPRAYGGHGGSLAERLAICEEMLAAGAPVGMHWVADRQSGPQIARHGSETARRRILPEIVAGRCCIGIGMSEPGAGSDLAAVRTRAARVDGGWALSGSKLWTSNAHRADYIIALARTAPAGEARHDGLTQFIVDMRASGVRTSPIADITGSRDFNEVFLDDVFVPDDFVLGAPGDGWRVVTGELAYERSGPDRFMSTFPLFAELVARLGRDERRDGDAELGRLFAHLVTLRQMSHGVVAALAAGAAPDVEAALVKDMGARFEGEIATAARRTGFVARPAASDPLEAMLAEATLAAPSFSLRGGTREILRGIVARGLGLR